MIEWFIENQQIVFPDFAWQFQEKSRIFAKKPDIELNEWFMRQVEERYINLLTDFGFKFIYVEIAKFTPQEVREYEASKKAYRDIKNSTDTAKQEGKQEGLAEGMELGMAKGVKEL